MEIQAVVIILTNASTLGEALDRYDRRDDEDKDRFSESFLPLFRIIIYCPPCSCLIASAIRMCRELSTRWIELVIRPDMSLPFSCCSSGDAVGKISTLCNRIRAGLGDDQSTDSDSHMIEILDWVDLQWTETMLEEEEETPIGDPAAIQRRDLRLDEMGNPDDKLIILGEAECLRSETRETGLPMDIDAPAAASPRYQIENTMIPINGQAPFILPIAQSTILSMAASEVSYRRKRPREYDESNIEYSLADDMSDAETEHTT